MKNIMIVFSIFAFMAIASKAETTSIVMKCDIEKGTFLAAKLDIRNRDIFGEAAMNGGSIKYRGFKQMGFRYFNARQLKKEVELLGIGSMVLNIDETKLVTAYAFEFKEASSADGVLAIVRYFDISRKPVGDAYIVGMEYGKCK